jgi:hypothetical protein
MDSSGMRWVPRHARSSAELKLAWAAFPLIFGDKHPGIPEKEMFVPFIVQRRKGTTVLESRMRRHDYVQGMRAVTAALIYRGDFITQQKKKGESHGKNVRLELWCTVSR